MSYDCVTFILCLSNSHHFPIFWTYASCFPFQTSLFSGTRRPKELSLLLPSYCTTMITYQIILLVGLLGLCFTSNLTIIAGHLGDTLIIDCPYHHRNDRWGKKLWCKEAEDGRCRDVLYTKGFWHSFKKNTNNSTYIYDDIRAGIVTVNITLLEKELAGTYQCQSLSLFEKEVNVLRRVLVKVLMDPELKDLSDLDKVNYSISRLPGTSQIPLMWVIVGSSLLAFKLVMMGLICNWLKNRNNPRVLSDATLTTNPELFTPEERRDENVGYETFYVCTDEIHSNTPLYSNYVHINQHLNNAYWER
uniref:Uncharacterized protein n=1 Tax=Leptobrachium leishanense TaxID=445787 RepID=A0A8C5LIM9_9ANUR